MSTEVVMLSNHLILCRPFLLLPSIFPSIRVLSNESALHIRWPKYWSFSFSNSASNEWGGSRGWAHSVSWITALWWRHLRNSMKLWAMPCRATRDGWVIVKSSDKVQGNGNPSSVLPWRTLWTVWAQPLPLPHSKLLAQLWSGSGAGMLSYDL